MCSKCQRCVQKLCPIFFSKADLDLALTSAHTTRQRCQTDDYLKQADECQKTYTHECAQFAAATDDRAKKLARERLEKAQAEEEQLREKARQVSDAALPKVGFGSSVVDACVNVLMHGSAVLPPCTCSMPVPSLLTSCLCMHVARPPMLHLVIQ
jgi:hypothetical protein